MDTDISELIEKNFTSAQLTTLQLQFIHTTIFNNSSKKKKKKRYNIAIQMAAVNFTSVGYFTQNCHIKIQ